MKNLFNFGRKRTQEIEREEKQPSEPQLIGLKLPEASQLALSIIVPHDQLDRVNVSDLRLELVERVKDTEFRGDLAEIIQSENDLLATVPSEWFASEFETRIDRLNLDPSVNELILGAKKGLCLQAREQFTSALDAYRYLSFVATCVAREYQGIVMETHSLKVYRFDDPTLDQFNEFEICVPTLYPFLSVTTKENRGRFWLTTRGLSRFGLPEFALQFVENALCKPSVHLLNGLAQSLIEQVVEAKALGASVLPLDKPFSVSTDNLIVGNDRNLPFNAIVPKATSLQLKHLKNDTKQRLVLDYPSPENQHDALIHTLQTLGLMPPADLVT